VNIAMHDTRRMRPLLGTFVEIGASGNDAYTLSAIESAFSVIADVHARLSFQQRDSELSQLNSAPGEWVPMSTHSLRVLRLARSMMRASGQIFDCTLGGALIARGVLPNHAPNKDFLLCGNADDIDITAGRARLKRPVRITLDGIAKGYAVDCAIAVLKRHGLSRGGVNAGGDMRVFGDRVVPVLQRQSDGSIKSLGGLRAGAIATSHVAPAPDADLPGFILGSGDSATHAPRQGGVFSVIARHAWRADALTKVAALAPVSERAQRVAALGGLLAEDALSCAA